MKYLVIFLILIFERAIGSHLFVIPAITVLLYSSERDSLPALSMFVGIMTDFVFGNPLGLSSMIFIISSIEISLYKAKLESQNLWSIFLFGLLVSAQIDLFWSITQPPSRYFVHALLATVFYLIGQNLGSRRSGGVYLRA